MVNDPPLRSVTCEHSLKVAPNRGGTDAESPGRMASRLPVLLALRCTNALLVLLLLSLLCAEVSLVATLRTEVLGSALARRHVLPDALRAEASTRRAASLAGSGRGGGGCCGSADVLLKRKRLLINDRRVRLEGWAGLVDGLAMPCSTSLPESDMLSCVGCLWVVKMTVSCCHAVVVYLVWVMGGAISGKWQVHQGNDSCICNAYVTTCILATTTVQDALAK